MTTTKTIDLDSEVLISHSKGEKYETSSSTRSSLSPDRDWPVFSYASTTTSTWEEVDGAGDHLFLGLRTPPYTRTPNNSPVSPEVPVASLIDLKDDPTIVPDSCSGTTIAETSVTWASLNRGPSCTHTHLAERQWLREGGVGESAKKSGEGVNAGDRGSCGGSLRSTLLPKHRVTPSSATSVTSSASLTAVGALTTPALNLSCCISPATQRGASESTVHQEIISKADGAKTKCQDQRYRQTEGAMCKENNNPTGGVAPNANSAIKPVLLTDCSTSCAEKYAKLSQELSETKDKLLSLSLQMEDQASHITKLLEENRRYVRENGQLKTRPQNGANNGNYNCYNNEVYASYPDGSSDLGDRIMALQLQNSELHLCLEREKRRRKEVESRLEREEGYIKRLEDSVQTLRGTRVVMDPSTYRQVAEAYIAGKRTPARRPHTHSGVPGSDLVCDSSRNNQSMVHKQRLSHPVVHQSASCPSSPDSCSSPYQSLESQEYQMYPKEITLSRNGKTKKDLNGHNLQDLGRGLGVGGNTMNPWDYQQLLKSLEDLDGASRGALS